MSNLNTMSMEQLKRALALAVEDGNEIIQFRIKKEIRKREEAENGPDVA